MELWNSRKLPEPPTYTYKSQSDEIDIEHLRNVLHDGIVFYKNQTLLNTEIALLKRMIYRMKPKFRGSKDFRSFENVKRALNLYSQIEIEKKLHHLASILPLICIENETFLPTKNMIDFILVRLQGIGKILCRTVDLCKLTAELYERFFRVGHHWRMGIIVIGIVSRVHVLALNIIKFTCLLYLRLLPYSNKLKNTGEDWLPEGYNLPKDLKEWLDIEWDKLEEIIEIPDNEFDRTFFDLCDDSDDDVEYCEEYIEIKDDDMGLKPYKKMRNNWKNFDDSVVILRGFASNEIDTGEVISDRSEDEQIEIAEELKENDNNNAKSETELIKNNKNTVTFDIGEVISSDEIELLQSDEDESVLFVEEVKCDKKKRSFDTSEFIALDSQKSDKKAQNQNLGNELNNTVIEIKESPKKKKKRRVKVKNRVNAENTTQPTCDVSKNNKNELNVADSTTNGKKRKRTNGSEVPAKKAKQTEEKEEIETEGEPTKNQKRKLRKLRAKHKRAEKRSRKKAKKVATANSANF